MLDELFCRSGLFDAVCADLKAAGVDIFSGPNLARHLTFGPPLAPSLRYEYGDLACTVEIVSSVYEAIDHVHKFGSGHTDAIVAEDDDIIKTFLDGVDSACVFANCSTRMSDGYRMGLGNFLPSPLAFCDISAQT